MSTLHRAAVSGRNTAAAATLGTAALSAGGRILRLVGRRPARLPRATARASAAPRPVDRLAGWSLA